MQLKVFKDKEAMGRQAAADGAAAIRRAIAERGGARIIVATGASQFQTLAHLVQEKDIAWDKVEGFHMDEYVGLPITHPASFRRYLWERFVSRLPLPLKSFCYLDGDDRNGDPVKECERAGRLISAGPIDVCFGGIGENGHLAFNDPPADFDTDEPYLIVDLDEACRRQQFGEGWFKTLEDVPKRAISISIRQTLKSGLIVCSVPDERKSVAVRNSVEGPVTPDVPASILQRHPNATIYVDEAGASKLSSSSRA